MVKQVVGGIRVSDEHLAVDDIGRAGAFGDYLSLDHHYGAHAPARRRFYFVSSIQPEEMVVSPFT